VKLHGGKAASMFISTASRGSGQEIIPFCIIYIP
jgi:hypothetical protein